MFTLYLYFCLNQEVMKCCTTVCPQSISEYLKHINSPESYQYGYGAYLVGDFKLDNGRGADILSIWWYNRNLRIFRKLQEMTDDANDRILVVIGNGHAKIFVGLYSLLRNMNL